MSEKITIEQLDDLRCCWNEQKPDEPIQDNVEMLCSLIRHCLHKHYCEKHPAAGVLYEIACMVGFFDHEEDDDNGESDDLPF